MRRNAAFRLSVTVALLALPFAAGANAASRERDKATPQEVFDAMRDAFRPEKARGVHARYQFLIGGAEGGEWWIEENDGKCKFGRGHLENPNVTLIARDKDWVALSNDQLSGVWASVTGRLKVRGNQALARKLDEMFP